MGGGSSSLSALRAPSILDSLRDRFGDSIVGHAVGATIDKLVPPLPADQLRTPDGKPGLRVELRNGTVSDADSEVEIVSSGVAESTALLLSGDGAPSALDASFTVTLVGEIIPPADGAYELGAAIAGGGRVVVGDTVVIDDPDRRLPRSDLWFGFGSHEFRTEIEAAAGVPIPVRMTTTGRRGTAAMRLGMRPIATGSLIDSAVALAAEADVAVVVVGTNDEWESEGVDRETLALPGEQDDLVRRVAANAARTVVVVNSGAPVVMPWIDEVDAVVIAGFAGIETGPAVAAVLAGDADPGGRLPVTYPVRLEDCPAWPHYAPVDGVQTYGEGRNVGYRGYLASGTAPLLPFGHGLSYGSSLWSDIVVRQGPPDAGATVSVRVTNTGSRAVTDVVQVYVTHPHVGMAPMTLAGFAKTTLAAGDTDRVDICLDEVAIRRWDESAGGWVIDDGDREIIVARSASDIVARLTYPSRPPSQEQHA